MNRKTSFFRFRRGQLLLLLLIPYLLLLWPGLYNFDQPELVGVPFFYWYQAVVLLITACTNVLLYQLEVDYEPHIKREEGVL